MKVIYTYSTISSRWSRISFHSLHQRTEIGLFIENNIWNDIYPLLLQYIAQNIKEKQLFLTHPSPSSVPYTTIQLHTPKPIGTHQ